jgi:predicted O-linked N-acetylglucosamine transferase (SPINDLY family)
VKKYKQNGNPLLKAQVHLLPSSTAPSLQRAIELHQLGRLDQAEVVYRQLIKIEPRNADALHLLGVIAIQTGHYQGAVEVISRAIEINSNVANFYSSLGIALQELKQLDAALASYDKAISHRPDYAGAYFSKGNILHSLRQLDEAVSSYDMAILLKPDYVEAYSNRGIVLLDLKQFEASVASYSKAIELKPDYAAAYFNRANALVELKQLVEAVANYEKAIVLKPDYVEAYSNRGNILRDLKQLEAAVTSYDKAIVLKSDYAEAYSNRGNVLLDLKQFQASVASYNKAIELNPDYAAAYFNRGNALVELKQLVEAVENYDKAIDLKPDYVEAYSNRGNILRDLKQLEAAVTSYDKAIVLKSDYAEAYSNRGNVLHDLKQFEASVASYNRAIELKPDYAEAYYNLGIVLHDLKQLDAALASFDKALALKPEYDYLFGMRLSLKMNMCDWQDFEMNVNKLSYMIRHQLKATSCFSSLSLPITLSDQRQAAELFCRHEYPLDLSLSPILKTQKKRKIRIGYYSADFHIHPVSILSIGLFEHHDKSKFEIIAFSLGPDSHDEMRDRIVKVFDEFLDVQAKPDKEVAQLSRTLCIDIAIDLGGHTKNSRPGIFACRAAPIQVIYLGYPGTMGAPFYDYLIADKVLIPERSRVQYVEKIAYLPDCSFPGDPGRKISDRIFNRAELGLPQTGFIFCCFNNEYKINPQVFDIWIKILQNVSDSVLWLKEPNATARLNLLKEAAKRGLDADRIIFSSRVNDLSEHLARLKVADLFLDTFPYNAHATALDALWAGLPIVTCLGESFASRVAASLLSTLKIPELITSTPQAYTDLAIDLAQKPAMLQTFKNKLAENLINSPLFDLDRYCGSIEVAYSKMYDRYLTELSPEDIYID